MRSVALLSLVGGLALGGSAGYWTGWMNRPATPYGPAAAPAKVQQAFQVGSAATGATFGPEGTLAVGTARGSVTVFDMHRPEQKTELVSPDSGPITRTAFSPGGSVLAAGSDDGTVRLWRNPMQGPQDPTAELKMREDGQYGGAVTDLAYSPDGKILVVASSTSTVRIWDVSSPRSPRALAAPGRDHAVTRLAFNPSGTVLAVGSTDGTVQLWDLTVPANPRTIEGGQVVTNASVTALAFSADKKSLAVANSRGAVQLWNVADPASPRKVDAARAVGYTNDLSFNAPGYILAAGNSDGTVRVWEDLNDLMNPRILTRETNQGALSSVAFANGDDNTLAVTGTDGSVQLWTA
ncbi:WD40 repeat domain-containing protein [Streptomyces cadmiisoli]|uniref:WD40 repeat domain-containing protein n=1 Tax=Streptomyces cadmiisoli TaxID=2184053 RepID=UPI003648A725